jgi:hypothetical protein
MRPRRARRQRRFAAAVALEESVEKLAAPAGNSTRPFS